MRLRVCVEGDSISIALSSSPPSTDAIKAGFSDAGYDSEITR